jgi:hypothetical protein
MLHYLNCRRGSSVTEEMPEDSPSAASAAHNEDQVCVVVVVSRMVSNQGLLSSAANVVFLSLPRDTGSLGSRRGWAAECSRSPFV